MIADAMKPVMEENKKLRSSFDSAFGFGGSAARQIGGQVGSKIEQIA
jgi:hypothetical protein